MGTGPGDGGSAMHSCLCPPTCLPTVFSGVLGCDCNRSMHHGGHKGPHPGEPWALEGTPYQWALNRLTSKLSLDWEQLGGPCLGFSSLLVEPGIGNVQGPEGSVLMALGLIPEWWEQDSRGPIGGAPLALHKRGHFPLLCLPSGLSAPCQCSRQVLAIFQLL